MSEIKLNLARKWRSRTFDEVVGQELPIRMLKNSLYLDHYFPVYLFSGQRGCGKTTAARIFAGAVNCDRLDDFQKDPKEIIPCLTCKSCLAMKSSNHPDFIEIDAASHTGVDNVRQIIDAAALMPLLGRKKIYLIDEAHMLSKAAFNAFLKILEEPPSSVFFILATTDPHKIIETVKSRCFQVFFKALEAEPLVNHLVHVCTKEEIPFEHEALSLLVKQTEGSVRDALNLLEQVRFTARSIDMPSVLLVLGHLDEERLFELLDRAFNGEASELVVYLQRINLESFSASIIWKSCIDILQISIWYKYGALLDVPDKLKEVCAKVDVGLLRSSMHLFFSYEPLFLKTRTQHRVLEYVLLQICSNKTEISTSIDKVMVKKKSIVEQKSTSEFVAPTTSSTEWQSFLKKINALDDPLVASVFKQGEFKGVDNQVLDISFPENLSFFGELLENTKNAWQPLIKDVFGEGSKLNPLFDGNAKPGAHIKPVAEKIESKPNKTVQKPVAPKTSQRSYPQKNSFKKVEKKAVETAVDISDEAKWKKSHIILKVFPGTVVEIPEDEHA